MCKLTKLHAHNYNMQPYPHVFLTHCHIVTPTRLVSSPGLGTTSLVRQLLSGSFHNSIKCNVSWTSNSKPRQLKSILIHKWWFTALIYNLVQDVQNFVSLTSSLRPELKQIHCFILYFTVKTNVYQNMIKLIFSLI